MTTTTTSSAPVQNEAGVLEHLDPTGLVIETNVRTEGLILDAEFVDSVRTHGVLVPVLGWRHTDGTVHVRAGQRRTLAAREAQAATIPVYVVQADDDSTAVRIVEQLVENENRQALTDTNRVAAWPRTEWALLSPHVRGAERRASRMHTGSCGRSSPSLDPSLLTSFKAMGTAMGFGRLALSWPATSAVRLLNHPHSAEKRC